MSSCTEKSVSALAFTTPVLQARSKDHARENSPC